MLQGTRQILRMAFSQLTTASRQIRSHFPPPSKVLRSEKGVALLITLFAVMLLTFIAVEVSFDTGVDYVVASQQVNRLKAYYAAKSGVEISLIRIMLYKQVMISVGDSLGPNKSMLDPIWSFPFMWPPIVPPSDSKGVTEVDKDMLKSAVADSLMQNVSYEATITPEGNKIDLNDLGSPVKSLKTAMIQQVLNIFKSEIQHNEEFQKKYAGYNFEELVNNIADYVDEDKESLNGGDESGQYRDIDEKDVVMPPNRSFRTVDELHQVAKMTDDFYNILAPRVTVFGTKGININYADPPLLMALDPTMTEEAVQKIIERRSDPKMGGPFKDDKDFFGFVRGFGVNTQAIEKSKIPLLYDMEFNFRIVAKGRASNVKRTITAVTFDFPNLSTRLAELLDKQDQDQSPSGTPQPNPTPNPAGGAAGAPTEPQKPKLQAPKGRPTVVYWEEN